MAEFIKNLNDQKDVLEAIEKIGKQLFDELMKK
jgi:hypothetical protein